MALVGGDPSQGRERGATVPRTLCHIAIRSINCTQSTGIDKIQFFFCPFAFVLSAELSVFAGAGDCNVKH